MNIGTALVADGGMASLRSDVTYHLFSNSASASHVTLVFFDLNRCWKAHFIGVPREAFESGLSSGKLLPAVIQPTLPPWLSDYEGMDCQKLEMRRMSHKISYQARAEYRLSHILPLINCMDEISLYADPESFIRKHAALAKPVQNADRIALWFAAFIVFGRQLWSLMPAFSNIGFWDRSSTVFKHKKFGRPPLRPETGLGHSAVPLATRIQDAYHKHCGLSVSMREVYSRAMHRDFGCKIASKDGEKFYYHPTCAPFPSLRQFVYWAQKQFGAKDIKHTLVGDARFRSRDANYIGIFTEGSSNLLERTETDAYQVVDRPREMLTKNPGPPLIVAVGKCSTSSYKVGIGFAYGGEDKRCYQSMLFCMAVPKVFFCGLFGIEIAEEAWPGHGLPPYLIADRGPASGEQLSLNSDGNAMIRELAPSYMGQSKALIEASHPRTTATEGAPTHFVSALNVFEMVRREIKRLISDNERTDVTKKLTHQMVADGVSGRPLAVWNYLDQRGRTDAMQMDIHRAIRSFLMPTKFQWRKDGLWLESMRFDSAALHSAREQNTPNTDQSFAVDGYVLPMCVRTAWVDIGGSLIEIHAKLQIRDDESQTYLSLHELKESADKRRAIKAKQRAHSLAAAGEREQSFESETGKKWNAGARKGGQAPKKSVAQHQQVPTAPGGRRAKKKAP